MNETPNSPLDILRGPILTFDHPPQPIAKAPKHQIARQTMRANFSGNAKQRRLAKRRALRKFLWWQATYRPPKTPFPNGFGELELIEEEVAIHIPHQPYARFIAKA